VDFDSAIPRFESWRPSQILYHKISWLDLAPSRLGSDFMLRDVAKIYMHFQGSPFVVGSSTQHERNMKWDDAARQRDMRLRPVSRPNLSHHAGNEEGVPTPAANRISCDAPRQPPSARLLRRILIFAASRWIEARAKPEDGADLRRP
jgi:hypothetical protein